jgi:hypothetical protein
MKGGRWCLAAYDNRPTFSLTIPKADSSSTTAALLGQETEAAPSQSSTQDFFCSPPNVVAPNAPLQSSKNSEVVLTSQPKLRKQRKLQWEIDSILEQISNNFNSLGEFMKLLLHQKSRDMSDERTPRHRMMVSLFLSGRSTIALIYNHSKSQPSKLLVNISALYARVVSPIFSVWRTWL